MRTYTFEDLTRDHNVNDLAAHYRRNGTRAAQEAANLSLDEWWHWNSTTETLAPLHGYARRNNVLTCSVGVERFAWMHFKEGWHMAKQAARP